jgi:predicted transcriptional regulator
MLMCSRQSQQVDGATYSLRLGADRRGKLEEIARRKDRDLSYVIRKAIDEYIERHQYDPDGD